MIFEICVIEFARTGCIEPGLVPMRVRAQVCSIHGTLTSSESSHKGTTGDESGRPGPFAKSYMVGRENKRTNNRAMLPTLKNNAAAGYKGPVKTELLKGAGLLDEPLAWSDRGPGSQHVPSKAKYKDLYGAYHEFDKIVNMYKNSH